MSLRPASTICRIFSSAFKQKRLQRGYAQAHIPVMAREVVEHLNPRPGQVFLDMTFGAGGHSRALLEVCPDIMVFCLDRDPLAMTYAAELSASFKGKVFPVLGKFSDAESLLSLKGCPRGDVDGVIMDLGASSMQFDLPDRGFGLGRDSPLDMRMSASSKPSEPTAADVVNCLTASQLAHIFKAYGEERFARRIANAIVEHRSAVGPIRTTGQLADLVASVVSAPTSSPNSWIKEEVDDPKLPHSSPMHVATRVFQALRIFVNNELNELCCGLETAHTFLKVGGRATVISFHSLEDRLVKWAFTNNVSDSKAGGLASQLAATSNGAAGSARLQRLLNQLQPQSDVVLDSPPTPKTAFWCQVNGVIIPSQDEVHRNKRSRSAKLRIAEKRNVGTQ
ncbi:hypothetical protein AAHC03_01578 [Spirometra sp. Aus1]